MNMHRKQKGSIGQIAVMLEIARLGLPVFTEYSDNSKADIITIVDNIPIRIQVKVRALRGGKVEVESRKSAHGYSYRYSENDFDILAVHVTETGQTAYVSVGEFLTRSTFTLRVHQPKKQDSSIRMIDDYLDFHASVAQWEEHSPFKR